MTIPNRAGIAFLLVLAAVLVLTSASTLVLQARWRLLATAAQDQRQHQLGDLTEEAEGVALDWLTASAQRVVLPPAGGGLVITAESWDVDDNQVSVHITAFDRLAMVPHDLAVPGAVLQGMPPPALRRRLVARTPPSPGSPDDLLERLPVPPGWRRFPRSDPQGIPGDTIPNGNSLAGAIAPDGDGRINVNTAPMALLETAYTALALEGAGVVADARRTRTWSEPPGNAATTPSPAANLGVRLVASSNRWSFLITVSAGDQQRSWWMVAVGNPAGAAMVQRHVAEH